VDKVMTVAAPDRPALWTAMPMGRFDVALERRSAATAGAHLFERVRHYQHPQMISPQTMEPMMKMNMKVGA
jgi:hypothetical protein